MIVVVGTDGILGTNERNEWTTLRDAGDESITRGARAVSVHTTTTTTTTTTCKPQLVCSVVGQPIKIAYSRQLSLKASSEFFFFFFFFFFNWGGVV